MCGWFYTTHTRKVLVMNRQKQYLADNVDAMGNVFPTVGENIRRGAKLMNIEGVTNVRLLYINIDVKGNVTLSENLKCSILKHDDKNECTIVLPKNVCCSYPIMVISENNKFVQDIYTLCTYIGGDSITLKLCPYGSRAVFIIGNNERY